jgi:hypothetical protein
MHSPFSFLKGVTVSLAKSHVSHSSYKLIALHPPNNIIG